MSDAATFTGVNFAVRDGSPLMSDFVPSKEASDKLYSTFDVCFASGTDLGSGSTLKVGKLPAGAVVLYSMVYPIAVATFGAPDAMTNAVTGTLGITGDTNLFGAVGALNATATQVVMPSPDGTTYTIDADEISVALKTDVDVLFTSASAELVAAEGIVVKIFYTV